MRKFWTMMLAGMLLFSGVSVQAMKNEDSVGSPRPADVLEYKYTEEVADQKGKPGKQAYLVEFKTELDLEEVTAAGFSGQGADRKSARAKAVVAALKQDADRVQKPFQAKLEREGLSFKSFYAVNMMRIEAGYDRIMELAEDPLVSKVYLDREIRMTPLEPEEASEAIPGNIQWNVSRVGADQLWRQGIDGTGVVVGIIDSGVDWTHPALRSRFRAYDPAQPATPDPTKLNYSWYDAVNYRRAPYDDNGHGTHVTGTILGQTPELALGIAPGAKWIGAKILNADGAGAASWILGAGQWMLAPNGDPAMAPDIINNSWGGDDTMDDWFRSMVRNWRAAGIVPVFAAGNQNTGEPLPWSGSIANPAHYPESFAVAATDSANDLGSFSKLGPSPYEDKFIKPDVSAPGVNISSATPGGGYATYSGTSMAAPHVAGAAALVLSGNPQLSVDDVLYALLSSAYPLTSSAYPDSPNMAFGHGLIKASTAYDLSRNGFARASLSGTVTDEVSGVKIMGATIRLLQQPTLAPADTGLDGSFAFEDVPAGSCRVSIIHPRYGTKEQTVTLPAGSSRLDLTLTYPGAQSAQLSYDDGSQETALVYDYGNNNGFGVVFQPQRYGLIRSISAYFWDYSYPSGTGTAMDLVLYEADRSMYPTGNALTKPIRVSVKRGGWKEFDISGLNVRTGQPFVAVFHQPYDRANSPALAIDKGTRTGINHSYLISPTGKVGALKKNGYYGTFMVRANIDYSMEVPSITGVRSSQPDGRVINHGGKYFTAGQGAIIEGTALSGSEAELLHEHSVVGSAPVVNAAFSLLLPALNEGEQAVQALVRVGGKPAAASDEIRIIQDLAPPVIQLDGTDGGTAATRMFTLTGQVDDLSPVTLAINGQAAATDETGRFSQVLMLVEGANTIRLSARDLLGHTTEKTVEILFTPGAGDVTRIAGGNRYSTAVAVSRKSFDRAARAVLVTGLDYPDGLSSGPLAYAMGGPILLTAQNELDSRTAAELSRLGVKEVVIMGGPLVISEAVAETLTGMGITATRIAGANRYWTAANAAVHMKTYAPATDHVTLASGESFADALAAGSAAAVESSPILLTKGDQLSFPVRSFIAANGIKSVDLIGGTLVISQAVEDELKALGVSVQRYSGTNRFATSIAIAREKLPNASEVVFVNGRNFPDALSAAPFAASLGAPVILVDRDSIHTAVKGYLPGSSLSRGFIVGGEAVVDHSVQMGLIELLMQ